MLPLVPVFMALVGVTTNRRVQRQYAALARLSGHFLDLLRGLDHPAHLRAGARGRNARCATATERYRRETMSALRIAFLSALVLDLVAALSVAVVAVDVGLRLDAGGTVVHDRRWSCCCWRRSCSPRCGPSASQYHASQEGGRGGRRRA